MTQKILVLGVALILTLFLDVQYSSGQQHDSISDGSVYHDLSNQQADKAADDNEYRNSLEIGPDYDIYFIQFCRKFSSHDEIILGISYLNSSIGNLLGYPGHEQLYALEFGYRRYLWRNLHLEFHILPQYVICNDTIYGDLMMDLDWQVKSGLATCSISTSLMYHFILTFNGSVDTIYVILNRGVSEKWMGGHSTFLPSQCFLWELDSEKEVLS